MSLVEVSGFVQLVRCETGFFVLAFAAIGVLDYQWHLRQELAVMARRGRVGNGGFRGSARRVHHKNYYTPVRGGIRL